jgi:hypothetical protein
MAVNGKHYFIVSSVIKNFLPSVQVVFSLLRRLRLSFIYHALLRFIHDATHHHCPSLRFRPHSR